MHREPAVAIEVHPAAKNAYHAHAAARFQGCVCIPKPNATNPQSQILAMKSWFFVVQFLWESHTNLQSGSLLQVTNWHRDNTASLSGTPEEFKAKSESEN